MIRSLLYLFLFIIITSFSVCSQQQPEYKALQLAKQSHALSINQSVESFIDTFLKEGSNEIKGMGWDVRKEEDQQYLVTYIYKIHSFKYGIGERGYFFLVDLNNGSVRNLTAEYVQKMPPLQKPYTDERELADDLLKQHNENWDDLK